MTKPTKLVCAQQRLRSAWASAVYRQAMKLSNTNINLTLFSISLVLKCAIKIENRFTNKKNVQKCF